MKNQVNIPNNTGLIKIYTNGSSSVSSAISALLQSLITESDMSSKLFRKIPSNVSEKINYNNALTFTTIFDHWYANSNIIENAIFAIDKEIPKGKESIYLSVQRIYRKTINNLGYCDALTGEPKIELIKENSKIIFETILNSLLEKIANSSNAPEYCEHIEIGTDLLLAHLFIECLIFETLP